MRNVTTLVGLTLFALAPTARAQAAAPAAATAALPAGAADAAPAPAAAPPATPAGDAVAPALGVAAQVEPPAPKARKLQLGVSFLPMGLGKYVYRPDATSPLVKSDAYFAYGASISVAYEVLPHLLVGVAPQAIWNVQEKTPEVWTKAVSEYDLMARVAYMLPVAETIKVYGEFLPGYSLVRNIAGSAGWVLAFGAGVAMDLTDRFFANIGGGYQIGFQKWANGATSLESGTRYIRVALGAGMKF